MRMTERLCDENWRKDSRSLPRLHRTQAHAQRNHAKHGMLAVRTIKHENVFELANMVPARMAVLLVDFLLDWLFEVLSSTDNS